MLVLSVKPRGESVVVHLENGDEVEVRVSEVRGNRVYLGVNAPRRLKITRQNRSAPASSDGESST